MSLIGEIWEIDPVKQMVATQRHLASSEHYPSSVKPIIFSLEQSSRGNSTTNVNERDSTRSISTMESEMPSANITEAQLDIADEDDNGESTIVPSPWICYRVVLMILLAMCVFVVGFVASCNSFRYEDTFPDNINIYYGFRGVKDPSTDRCVDWRIGAEIIGYDDFWTDSWLPVLIGMAITGMTIVVVAFCAWVAYGIILRSRRMYNTGVEEKSSNRPLWPVVVIGGFLILAGLVIFVSVMGNCNNIPPLMPGGPRCSLYAWSGLALGSSIALCFLGGILACFLECCCDCCCTRFMKDQLIDD